MAAERHAHELEKRELELRASIAEQELSALLRTPLESWDDKVHWQLSMWEFALKSIDDRTSTPKQLQLAFRAACEETSHPDEVPRLPGSLQIDSLAMALERSEQLVHELQYQLARFKRLYCSLLTGFGRFRKVHATPNETLLDLIKRTHEKALEWRPPGAPPKQGLIMEFKEKGRYKAEVREDTYRARHFDAGKTLSLRGTAGVTRGGARRYLKGIPEAQRPSNESYSTIRNHDMQAHHIQRSKALLNSFAVNRCCLQWDEVRHSTSVSERRSLTVDAHSSFAARAGAALSGLLHRISLDCDR